MKTFPEGTSLHHYVSPATVISPTEAVIYSAAVFFPLVAMTGLAVYALLMGQHCHVNVKILQAVTNLRRCASPAPVISPTEAVIYSAAVFFPLVAMTGLADYVLQTEQPCHVNAKIFPDSTSQHQYHSHVPEISPTEAVIYSAAVFSPLAPISSLADYVLPMGQPCHVNAEIFPDSTSQHQYPFRVLEISQT